MALPVKNLTDSSWVQDSYEHEQQQDDPLVQLLEKNQLLAQAVEDEQQNVRRLELTLRDYREKLDKALLEQSQLETDLFERDKKLEFNSRETTELRRQRNDLENNLSQEVLHYVNEKQTWLDKEAEYNQKIQGLEKRLAQTDLDDKIMTKSNSSAQLVITTDDDTLQPIGSQSPTSSMMSMMKYPVSPSGTSFMSSSASTGLTEKVRLEMEQIRTQMDTLGKEYSQRLDKAKTDIEELKMINARLVEENEGFQYLLSEKTIVGGFSLDDELRSMESDSDISDIPSTPSPHHNGIASGDTLAETPDARSLYDLQFEVESLKNQNNALRLSLERLVNRLLEYKQFERGIEERGKVPQRSVSAFQEKFWSYSTSLRSLSTDESASIASGSGSMLDVPRRRTQSGRTSPYKFTYPASGNGLGHRQNRVTSSSTWSSLIFNSNTTASPMSGNRIISLGVDSVLDSPRCSPTPRSEDSSATSSPGTISRRSKSIVDKTSITPLSADDDYIFEVRPAISSQNKLKPLELRSDEPRQTTGWLY